MKYKTVSEYKKNHPLFFENARYVERYYTYKRFLITVTYPDPEDGFDSDLVRIWSENDKNVLVMRKKEEINHRQYVRREGMLQIGERLVREYLKEKKS